MADKYTCTPIIKWAGGKRQLLPEIKELIPDTYETYYEPFFGGGAVFFDILPEKSVVNDSNPQLINLYSQIKENCEQVKENLQKLQDEYNALDGTESKKEYYYSIRSKFNACIASSEQSTSSASYFIFLNKCGYNGMYRENLKGLFNVPWGQKKTLNTYDSENLKNVAKSLENAKILCGDFEKACEGAGENDLVFFDSPYFGTFDGYQAGGFSQKDHERLASLFNSLSEKGAKCILTNSNTEYIKDLYKEYSVRVVDVKRMINRDADNRKGQEVIITNF